LSERTEVSDLAENQIADQISWKGRERRTHYHCHLVVAHISGEPTYYHPN